MNNPLKVSSFCSEKQVESGKNEKLKTGKENHVSVLNILVYVYLKYFAILGMVC